MGAWGAGPFENDDAADWIVETVRTASWEAVRQTLVGVADTESYVEAPAGSSAMAAAALVAATTGDSAVFTIPEDAASWVQRQTKPDESMRNLARRTVDRVVRDSEVQELWQDSPDLEQWLAVANDIASRLSTN